MNLRDFHHPDTPRVLHDAGVTIAGHTFGTNDEGRERLELRLDTPAGPMSLTDDAGGTIVCDALDSADIGNGVDALTEALDELDPTSLSSALDDLLTTATAAFRLGLAGYKREVADAVATDLNVSIAAIDIPDDLI